MIAIIILSDMVSLPVVVKWLRVRHIIGTLPALSYLAICLVKMDGAPPTLQVP